MGAAEKHRRKDGPGPMNASIFGPKQLVENFVEKTSRSRLAVSPRAPAKNAASIQMLTINILFSITYKQFSPRLGCQQGLFVRGPQASQMG
jgi:hypothetical protein